MNKQLTKMLLHILPLAVLSNLVGCSQQSEIYSSSRLNCEVTDQSGRGHNWLVLVQLNSRPKVVTLDYQGAKETRIIVESHDDYILGVDESTDYTTFNERKHYLRLDRYTLNLIVNLEEWSDHLWVTGQDSVKKPRLVLDERYRGNCEKLVKQI